ncbi:hypothetical protein MUK42_29497 [Musa troglodytarum]|uniref:Uncharacterized protein n=1 Tax=Musa troglodytarum TaxID=320322 RepID=A0A9E7FT96_9LILI|nr:hypothetical protein MUK42_29497 [Musa troglodytarum]
MLNWPDRDLIDHQEGIKQQKGLHAIEKYISIGSTADLLQCNSKFILLGSPLCGEIPCLEYNHYGHCMYMIYEHTCGSFPWPLVDQKCALQSLLQDAVRISCYKVAEDEKRSATD